LEQSFVADKEIDLAGDPSSARNRSVLRYPRLESLWTHQSTGQPEYEVRTSKHWFSCSGTGGWRDWSCLFPSS